MNTLAGLGVSSAAIATLSKEALAGLDPDIPYEVPRLGAMVHTNHDEVVEGTAAPQRKPQYYTIPRDKWLVVESAHDVRRQLEQELEGFHPGIDVAVRTSTSGHFSRKEVVVKYLTIERRDGEVVKPGFSFSSLLDRLPSKKTGIAGRGTVAAESIERIPIKAERVTITQNCDADSDSANYYTSEYFPNIPGGCYYIPPPVPYCTTGTPAYDTLNDEYVMIVAGHCVNGEVTQLYQNDEVASEYFGYPDPTRVQATSFDAGVVFMDNGASVDYSLAENTDSAPYGDNVYGALYSALIYDHEGDSSWTITKQGATTGLCSGWVTEASGHNFHTTAVSEGGDSGGPHYREDNYGRPLIGGIHLGHTSSGDSVVTTMDNIESLYDVTV